MNKNDPLTIPPAILALPDATATEKLLLSLYVVDPGARNYQALNALGVGLSGLKKIKVRLQAKCLLRSTANGWKVLVPGLEPAPEEGGHLVANSVATEKAHKVPPPRKLRSLLQILEEYDRRYDMAVYNPGGTFPGFLWDITEKALDEIQSSVTDDPLTDEIVAALIARRDLWLCMDYVSTNVPEKHRRKCQRLIANGTPEQLAELRARIGQAQLPGGKPKLLLAQLTGKKG